MPQARSHRRRLFPLVCGSEPDRRLGGRRSGRLFRSGSSLHKSHTHAVFISTGIVRQAATAVIDADDIIPLYRQIGFITVEDLDLVEQASPGRPIPAKVKSSSPKSWTRCSAKAHH
jgi:hypothetical protein